MADQGADANNPDLNNQWRTESPGHDGWSRTARAVDPDKYFVVSADGHVQEPSDLWRTRMDAKYADRLPGVSVNAKGDKFQTTEGFRPLRLQNIKFESGTLKAYEIAFGRQLGFAARCV